MKLTKKQLKAWKRASNLVSLESIKYAADIVGYTDLVTATVTTLEKLIAGRRSAASCRVLFRRAMKASYRDEPLLHAVLIALKWAASDGSGDFLVGNVVDAIYAVKLKARERNPDAETYKNLRKIHDRILSPYYQQLNQDQTG